MSLELIRKVARSLARSLPHRNFEGAATRREVAPSDRVRAPDSTCPRVYVLERASNKHPGGVSKFVATLMRLRSSAFPTYYAGIMRAEFDEGIVTRFGS